MTVSNVPIIIETALLAMLLGVVFCQGSNPPTGDA
jgi:hypothetical protein